MYSYGYDPNQQSPFPPGTILPAGQTIDVIYAQSYAGMQQQQPDPNNMYAPAGVDYNMYNQQNSYNSQPQQQHQQEYYQPEPSPRYSTEMSQRFKVNPSYAEAVDVGEQPAQVSNQPQYSSDTYSQYQPPYSSTNNSQQYSSTNNSQPYSSNSSYDQFNTQSQSYGSNYSSQNNYSQQESWNSTPTAWQPTQPAPTVQWQPPPSNPQDSSQNIYPPSPRLSHQSSNYGYAPQNAPTNTNTNVTYTPPLSPRPAYAQQQQQQQQQQPTYTPPLSPRPPYAQQQQQQQQQQPTYPAPTNYSAATTYSPPQPAYNSATTTYSPPQPSPRPSYASSSSNSSSSSYSSSSSNTPYPSTSSPQLPRLSTASASSATSSLAVPSPAEALLAQQAKLHQKALTEEREKMEKEREELLKQQQVLKLQQEQLKMEEDKLKAAHTQEELKLRNEIEKQRDEVEKMKAELLKQNAEKKQIQDQRDKVIEIQKGEMQRQMDELMKERELVKKHEEEMRRAMLEEQRLMLQQLQQQQTQLAQEQKSIAENAYQQELERQQEHARKIEQQRRAEEAMLKSRHDLELQHQALMKQMEEAKEAARKLEEQQRLAAEQRLKVEAQQKQTAEEKRQAEVHRKQAEEEIQKAIQQQKEQQDAFTRQQEQIKKKQADLTAEQDRVRLQAQDSEARIQAEKQSMATKLQEQQQALKKQQEDIKRQQDLVTFQQKELLIQQKEQQEQLEKEKASHAIKDLLAPMRQLNGQLQDNKPISPQWAAGKVTSPLQEKPSPTVGNNKPATPIQSPTPPSPISADIVSPQEKKFNRRDSRFLPNLDLNSVVDGYLLSDVVRAQRYARRWLMRKHFVAVVKQYHSSDDKIVDKLRHRNKALKEIYTSELSYVANLQLLCNFYLVPMQVESMVLRNFTDKDAAIIFSSVNTLLDVSKGLVAELEARLDQWPSVQLFGDIFVRLAPVMKLYAEYINNFDSASHRLKELLSTPEGYQFFESCKAKSRSLLDVNSLLIMPVQRVPRYELLLRELIRFTEETHVDYKNLLKAQKAIQQVNTYINQKKKDVDSRQKITAIQSQVKNCPNLMLAHRYFVYEGALQVSTTDKHKTGFFHFFLFNDLLLATKKAGGIFHRHDYEFVFSIDLTEAVVKRVSELTMFRIMIGGLEDINVAIYTFLCQSAAEKENWIKNFVAIGEDSSNSSKKLLVRDASQAHLSLPSNVHSTVALAMKMAASKR